MSQYGPDEVVVDPCDFMVGMWKRHLQWHYFGGTYQSLRTSNNVVVVDELLPSVQEDGVRFLQFSFGKSLRRDELQFGYVMKFTSPAARMRHRVKERQERLAKAAGGPESGGSGGGAAGDDSAAAADVIPEEELEYDTRHTETLVEWQYNGMDCHGIFQPETQMLVLNFYLKTSTVTINYRVLDQETMAVCVIDVTEGNRLPVVQMGNMCRVDEHLHGHGANQPQ